MRSIEILLVEDNPGDVDLTRANGYVAKPLDFEQLVQAIEAIDRFWFRIARLPNQAGG